MRKYAKALATPILALLIALHPFAAFTKVVTEYQLKAAFLYNFAHFVSFPDQQDKSGPFTFCIFESTLFKQALLATIENQYVNERPIRLLQLESDQSALTCQIIYFPDSEKQRFKNLFPLLQGKPILTVSSIKNFASNGGMIEFVRDNNKIRLYINNENAKAAGLTVKANLLSIATIVGN